MDGFDYKKIFAQLLGLQDPWVVDRAEFMEESREIHIYVRARRSAKYPCPVCGKMCDRYDDEDTERKWRHGDILFIPCYVHCRRPRVKCKDHGVRVVTAPWARPRCRYTLQYEGYAVLLAQYMPINQACKILRISNTSLTNIVRYWVKKAVDEEDLSDIHSICVDETAFKKGQSYVTVISDIVNRRVIDVEDGRDASAVEKFSYKLMQKGGDCAKIKLFVSDMSAAYKAAQEMCFPYSEQVMDKFHVKQLILKMVDEVRKSEQGARFSRSKNAGKKLLMKPQNKLTMKQQERLAELSKLYPKTGRAYRMAQVSDEMYHCNNPTEAEAVFKRLISWFTRSRLKPAKRVAESLKRHKNEILAYFKHRVTNALAEGINSLIQAAKRKARGYRTFEGYSTMIYLSVGRLKLSCPQLFT